MARTQKLKVYRTPIGFHDAYVAAASQKAALEAWGTDRNLFARGLAELVEDPELSREPLQTPGKVVRRSRGTTAEQLAALPADEPTHRPQQAARDGAIEPRAQTLREAAEPKKRARKPTPKPKRDRLDAAEQAIAEAEREHSAERDALVRQERELARQRERLEARHERDLAKLHDAAKSARDAYERAMRDWRG